MQRFTAFIVLNMEKRNAVMPGGKEFGGFGFGKGDYLNLENRDTNMGYTMTHYRVGTKSEFVDMSIPKWKL